jgi:anti-sigma factor RsiW
VTTAPGPIDEAELHAWVDGQLPEARRAAVAAWLEAHPDDRRRLAEWQRQNEMIDGLWAHVAAEPVPRRLRLESIGRRRRWLVRISAAAAVLALLLVGGTAGWLIRGADSGTGDAIALAVNDGLLAHRMFTAERRHAVEVPQADQQHLVSWLSNRLERQLHAPDLQALGLRLLGGRLLPLCGGGDPAAQLMYEDAAGNRYTLFATRGAGREQAVETLERDGMNAAYWADPRMAYVLIGTAPRDRLQAITRAVHEQLDGAAS